MMDAGRHPNITLMTYSEVEEVSGYIGQFKVKVASARAT
jgi:heterodisulfide reductase subunit A